MTDKFEVGYYWYDHLVLRNTGEAEIVTKAIQEHNFDEFIKIYNKYQNKSLLYFPDTASLWYNDEIIGFIDITKPTGFNLITYSEYECG